MITVHVDLFSTIRARIGKKKLELELPAGSTISDLKALLIDGYPDARGAIEYMLVSVNQEFTPDNIEIPDQAQVALFPYVTGGCNCA
jgi:molybdopterin synthase catalytic subunit/molybdopterin synthase sulfur carrier subunit